MYCIQELSFTLYLVPGFQYLPVIVALVVRTLICEYVSICRQNQQFVVNNGKKNMTEQKNLTLNFNNCIAFVLLLDGWFYPSRMAGNKYVVSDREKTLRWCNIPVVFVLHYIGNCFALSPRRPYGEYKRMVLEHTHGLFIT